MQEATIAIEDKNFYHEPGFSVTGILRATRSTYINNQVQGGPLLPNNLLNPLFFHRNKVLPEK